MDQLTFTDMEYAGRRLDCPKLKFLQKMDANIPWAEWVSLIEPFYPSGDRGRPPIGIERMLRMTFLQNWYSLSDVNVELQIYDSYAFRVFMKIDFMKEQVPDATTLLKFRHRLEANGLGKAMFDSIANALDANGLLLRGGTIIDATIIEAPSSTKNKENKRDEEMASTRKGNEWFFGMKAHIGVDAATGYIHSLETTPANVHDVTVAHKLIRDDDRVLYGDAGYVGIEKRDEIKNDEHLSKIDYRISRRHSSVPKTSEGAYNWDRHIERQKSSVRAKVEHPFLIVKRLFGFGRTVYRGLKKNTHRLYLLFASCNVVMMARAGRSLEPASGDNCALFS